jgi:hypothetical protein
VSDEAMQARMEAAVNRIAELGSDDVVSVLETWFERRAARYRDPNLSQETRDRLADEAEADFIRLAETADPEAALVVDLYSAQLGDEADPQVAAEKWLAANVPAEFRSEPEPEYSEGQLPDGTAITAAVADTILSNIRRLPGQWGWETEEITPPGLSPEDLDAAFRDRYGYQGDDDEPEATRDQ